MFTDQKITGSVSNLSAQYVEDPNSQNHERRKNYKPFVLWTPTLSILLGITILLIALTEYACQKLPNAENRGLVGSLNNSTGLFDELLPRQLDAVVTGPGQPGTPTAPDAIETPTDPGTFTPTPPPVVTSTQVTSIDGIGYTVEVTYGPPPQFNGTGGYPPVEKWLQLGTKTIGTQPGNSSPSPSPIQQPGETPAKATDPVNIPGQVDNNGGQPPVNGVGASGQPGNPVNNQDETPVVAPATFVAVASTFVDTLGNVITTSVPVALDSAGSTIRIASGQISVDATTTFLLTPTSSSLPDVKNGTTGNAGAVVHVFTKRDYIVGAFLPTVIAVIFAIPWLLIDQAAKHMEPIYQLAVVGGASPTNSLSLNYTSVNIFVAPFQAFSRKHWVIFITSILSLLSLLTAPLAVESIFISLTGTCNADTDGVNCTPTLSVYKTAARILEAVLASMALLLAAFIYLAYKRTSNVLAEPHSLAGVSSLMHNQEFLSIVRELPSSGIKEKALLGLLPPLRYTIGHYQNSDGTWGYGFMLSQHSSAPNFAYGHNDHNTYTNINLHNNIPDHDSLAEKKTNLWKRFFRVFQVLGFAFMLLGIMIIMAYYRFFDSDNSFGKFMSSQQFGVKFLFTSLGVIISQFWNYAREKIHQNEPYHNLARSPSTPRNSILISPSLAPITSIFSSIRRLSPLLILIDLSTILADALIITLSNAPFSSATTFEAWTICSTISLSILSFMIVTLLVILVRISRFGSSGQDVPNTVVGKCVLLCGSSMLERFEGLGEVEGTERRRRIEGWGKRFGIGRVRGVDGIVRKGVDFEEFVESSGRN